MIRFVVNGEEVSVQPRGPESLLFTLRERLGLPGSKNACEQGECGSCSVVLDGDLVCSCLVMTVDAAGSEVTTIEGIGPDGTLVLCPVSPGDTSLFDGFAGEISNVKYWRSSINPKKTQRI